MSNPECDAYAAGLIDGEGCIYVAKNKGKSYSPWIDIGMTRKALDVLKRLQREYGGGLNVMRAATDRWEEAWTLTLTGARAADMLTRILPYLRLKAEQARLTLTVWEIRNELPPMADGRRYWTDEAAARAERIRLRMHELNAKGPTLTPQLPNGATLIALRVAGEWMSPQRTLFDDLQWAPFSGSWPSAGLMRSGGLYSMPNISEYRNGAVASSLSEILETTVDPKYSLSPKAAAGILRRAAKRGKQLPVSLLAALEHLVQQA